MKILILLLAFLIVSPANTNSKTWGKTGHRVVGAIAADHLNKDAQEALHRILGHESLASAAIWMDWVRSNPQFDYMQAWHYVTIPRGMTYEETEKNPEGDIIKALHTIIDDLKEGNLSPEKEAQKLKILIHLVADIHMPLHVGNGTDRGGNDVELQWFWEPGNLHRVWDSGMIDESQLSYTELTKSINHPTKEQMNKWQNSTVLDWAYESRALLDEVYDLPENRSLSYEYMYHNYEIVQKRLLQAGVRLAGVLNEIYAD